MARKTQRPTVTPKELAEELNIEPKRLRSYLRSNFPRTDEERNTSWAIPATVADAVREHYAGNDEDEES